MQSADNTRDGGTLPSKRAGTARRLQWELVAQGLAITALVAERLYLAVVAPRPAVFSDEAASWATARYFAGEDPAINMLAQPPYSSIAGLVLAPFVWLVDGDRAQYRLFLALSTCLAIAGAFVARDLVRRVFSVSRPAASAVFVMAVLFPATTMSASFSWVEYLAPVWFLVVCWVLVRAADDPPAWVWFAGGLIAGTSPAVHGRFEPVPVVFAAVVLWTILPSRRPPRADVRSRAPIPILSVGLMLLALLVWQRIEAHVIGVVWVEPRLTEAQAWRSRLDELRFLHGVVAYSIGHLWYALASTMGVAGIGIGRLVVGIARPTSPQERSRCVLLACLTSSVLFVSATFAAANASGRVLAPSPEFVYYGRYSDPAVLLLAATGVAAIVELSRAAAWSTLIRYYVTVMFALASIGAIVRWLVRGPRIDQVFGPRIPGIWLLPVDSGAIPSVGLITVLAAAVLTVLMLASKWRVAVAMVGTSLLVLLSSFAVAAALTVRQTYRFDALVDNVPAPSAGRDHILVASDVAFDPLASLGVVAQQYFLVHAGWRLNPVSLSSEELLAVRPTGRTGLVLVRSDLVVARTSGFRKVDKYGLFQILVPDPSSRASARERDQPVPEPVEAS